MIMASLALMPVRRHEIHGTYDEDQLIRIMYIMLNYVLQKRHSD